MRTTFLCVTWRASSSSRLKRRSSSSRGLRVRRRLGPDHLERDRDFELLIPRLIDGAHAADAEQADDVVARAEVLTDRQAEARLQSSSSQPAGRQWSAEAARTVAPSSPNCVALSSELGIGSGVAESDSSRDGVAPDARAALRTPTVEWGGSAAATRTGHGLSRSIIA